MPGAIDYASLREQMEEAERQHTSPHIARPLDEHHKPIMKAILCRLDHRRRKGAGTVRLARGAGKAHAWLESMLSACKNIPEEYHSMLLGDNTTTMLSRFADFQRGGGFVAQVLHLQPGTLDVYAQGELRDATYECWNDDFIPSS